MASLSPSMPNEPEYWPVAPRVGDVLYCHFPQDLDTTEPEPAKARPCLVFLVRRLSVEREQFKVLVAFGTSLRTDKLQLEEFVIDKKRHAEAFQASGLAYTTKFDLSRLVALDYTEEWFTTRGTTAPVLGTIMHGPEFRDDLKSALAGAARAAGLKKRIGDESAQIPRLPAHCALGGYPCRASFFNLANCFSHSACSWRRFSRSAPGVSGVR